MKFDFVTEYPVHRSCKNFDLPLLSLSGWVRKLHFFSKVCTSTYWYVLPHINVEFLYCHVLSCTGMYWFVLLRTICQILSGVQDSR
jgi:hypothetical protein